MIVSKETSTMLQQQLAYELLKIITQTTIRTRHGKFPISPMPIDKVWNILNRVGSIEGITMLDQINAFEEYVKGYNG